MELLMVARLAWLSAFVLCLGGADDGVTAQSLPRDLKEWRLDYGLSAGITGRVRHVTVAQDGAIAVDEQPAGDHLAGRAPDELIAKIATFLKVARDQRPSPEKRRPIPDQASQWLSVTTGGREYRLAVTSDLMNLMDDVVSVAVTQAVTGRWSQSAWKLCKPAAQLAAADLDPPIESLVFGADGTFSVTWKGGGAHTTDVPHVEVPDYRGHYEISRTSDYIDMHIEGGLFVPSDFSGKGYFRMSGNQLTLRNVWLGTRRAKQKPDICELTFTKR
jgi:hypothetical protein